MNQTHCPKCQSENIYLDRGTWICPECAHEWTNDEMIASSTPENVTDTTIKDAHGNILSDGDSVILIKDLKIKGSSSSVKGGTKVKSIRLSDDGNGHNIACKIDGIGAINLKSEFVKKA